MDILHEIAASLDTSHDELFRQCFHGPNNLPENQYKSSLRVAFIILAMGRGVPAKKVGEFLGIRENSVISAIKRWHDVKHRLAGDIVDRVERVIASYHSIRRRLQPPRRPQELGLEEIRSQIANAPRDELKMLRMECAELATACELVRMALKRIEVKVGNNKKRMRISDYCASSIMSMLHEALGAVGRCHYVLSAAAAGASRTHLEEEQCPHCRGTGLVVKAGEWHDAA